MALVILGFSKCPLCNGTVEEGDDYVSTPHFLSVGSMSHCSDAAMHRQCFIAWPLASAFRDEFNEYGRNFPRPRQMMADGKIVEVSPDALPPRVQRQRRTNLGILGQDEERRQLIAALNAVEKRRR